MKKTMLVAILQILTVAAAFASSPEYTVYQQRYVKLGYADPKVELQQALARGEEDWIVDLSNGDMAHKEQVKQWKFVTDLKQNTRMQGMLAKLLPNTARPGLKITTIVIDAPMLNAFTFGGSYIYVTNLLLNRFSDDELAFTLAHEMSHIMGRHNYRRAQVMEQAAAMVEAHTLSAGEQEALNNLISRITEMEADVLALNYYRKAGYKVEAYRTVFQKFEAVSNQAVAQLTKMMNDAAAEISKFRQDCDTAGKLFLQTSKVEDYLKVVEAKDKLLAAHLKYEKASKQFYSIKITVCRTHPEDGRRLDLCLAMDGLVKGKNTSSPETVANYTYDVLTKV